MLVTIERRDEPVDGADDGGAAPAGTPPLRADSLLLRVVRFMSRITRPLAGHRFFPLWAVLHHRGRRSGRDYAVPVGVRVTADGYFIALPFGEQTQWVHNVIAAGGCRLRWRGEDLVLADPMIVGTEVASAAFPLGLRWVMHAAGLKRFIRLQLVRGPR